MFQYINTNDEDDRQRAIELVRETEGMNEFVKEPICITKEKADELIKKANWNLQGLNRLVKNEKPETNGKVPFYNWLEDRG